MEDVLKKNKIRLIAALLLSVIVLFANVVGSADEKQVAATKEPKKEILVARDVSLQHSVWCGDNTFLIVKKDGRLQVVNFIENKSKTILNPHNITLEACTLDSEWILYSNRNSVRWDKGTYERGVIDFWRYNLKTGKRQKFAVASDGSDIRISPDGKKFLFSGAKPRSFVEQPEPKWDLIWSKSGTGAEPQWLNDSSTILIKNKDKLFIEEIGKNTIHQFNIDLGLIKDLRIDKSNRIYLLESPKPPTWPKISSSDLNYRLQRCSIKGQNLDCEDVLRRNKSIARYDITPDGGKIIFIEGGKTWKEKTCVWLFEEGNPEVKCITPSANINSIISISPDGKKMVFTDYREVKNGVYTNDLYLINLTTK